jgi:methionyl-tRNA formyltransferase
MRIIFFGTSVFGCPTLEVLFKHYEIPFVITAKIKGKEEKVSPIKEFSDHLGIEAYTLGNPNNDEVISLIKNANPTMICVVAYRYILGKELLKIPSLGCVNLHPSLLPKYRGPAPIQWTLINGEKKTGVTTMLMTEEIDAGNILLQREVEIGENETYGELSERLARLGASLMLETIEGLVSGKIVKGKTQNNSTASRAPKITKEMRKIDWHKDAPSIANLIRALSPKPAAYCIFRGKRLEIIRTKTIEGEGQPSSISCTKDKLLVNTGKGRLEIEVLKPEARKAMSSKDFINGYHPGTGECVE